MKITLAASTIIALAVPFSATSRLTAISNDFDTQVKELAAPRVHEQVTLEESVNLDDNIFIFKSDAPIYNSTMMQMELNEHVKMWRAYRGEAKNYDMTFERVCYCRDYYRGPFRVQVRGGQVQSATYVSDSSAVDADTLSGLITVGGIFGQIQTAINGKYYDLQVAYNETAGYPTSVYSDQSSMIADDEMTYLISDVVLIEELVGLNDDDDGFKSDPPIYDPAAMQSELAAHRALWRSHADAANNYDMTFERSCFCMENYLGPFLVQVRSGQLEGATYLNGTTAEHYTMIGLPTIEDVFYEIQTGINKAYYDLQVTYNEVGYPSYVYSDPYSNWADDEMTYMISNVVLAVG
jgi:hypothetical protein